MLPAPRFEVLLELALSAGLAERNLHERLDESLRRKLPDTGNNAEDRLAKRLCALNERGRLVEWLEIAAHACVNPQQRDELLRFKAEATPPPPAVVEAAGVVVPEGFVEPLRRYLEWVRGSYDLLPPLWPEDDGHAYASLSEQYVQLAEQRVASPGTRVRLESLLQTASRGEGAAPRWTVQGDPGAGKTTLLRHVARDWAALGLGRLEGGRLGRCEVPIFASLARIDGLTPQEVAAAEHQALSARDPDVTEALEWALEAGVALVLLDGLDEIEPTRKGAVVAHVAGFAGRFVDCPVVLTSRRFGYRRPHTCFEELRLLGLGRTERARLLGAWLDRARVVEVLAEIDRSASLQDLAGNPFALTLLAAVARDGHDLPVRRTALYTRVVERLVAGELVRWTHWRGQEPPPGRAALGGQSAVVREVLGELCLRVLQDEAAGPAWSGEVLAGYLQAIPGVETLRRVLPPGADLLTAIAATTGFLHRPTSGAWAFVHRSLVEYLAAEALGKRGERVLVATARELSGRPAWYAFWRAPEDPRVGRWAEVFCHAAALEGAERAVPLLRKIHVQHPALAERALLGLDEVPIDVLCELLGAVGVDEVLVRAVIDRVETPEAAADHLLGLGRRTTEGRAFIDAGLVAVRAAETKREALAGAPVAPAWAEVRGETLPVDVLLAPMTPALAAVLTGTVDAPLGEVVRAVQRPGAPPVVVAAALESPAAGALAPLMSALSEQGDEGVKTARVVAERLDARTSVALLDTVQAAGRRPRMVFVRGGAFQMGSPEGVGYDDERPRHEVSLSPFWMASTAVTQGQYEAVMGRNPSHFTESPEHPVEQVSWEEAVAYCDALSKREGLPPEAGYRLPTEAEWEYACRGGTQTRWWCGDDESELGSVAWYGKNSEDQTHPVGLKRPNAWGLYDMHGNVWEWVGDWFGDYPSEPQADPCGPPRGDDRVIRGGSYWYDADWLRSAVRYRRWLPDDRDVGFRVVRPAPRARPSSLSL